MNKRLILALVLAAIFVPRGFVTGHTDEAAISLPAEGSAEWQDHIAAPAEDLCEVLADLYAPSLRVQAKAWCVLDETARCKKEYLAGRPCQTTKKVDEPSPFDTSKLAPLNVQRVR